MLVRKTHWHDVRCRFKEGDDRHAALLLATWIDGLGCQEFRITTAGEPNIHELVRRVRQLRSEGTTTVDGISPPSDSAANGITEGVTQTVRGFVRTRRAAVEEESAWWPHNWPTPYSIHGTPRRRGDLVLFGQHR